MLSNSHTDTFRTARMTRDKRFDGLFFIAVKTTGIFCRPICPANLPNEENVEYFTHRQQAMQAGYRPCLRCRPDSAPGSPAWRGVDTTVERALTLLLAYPDLSVENIANKLGITSRYLHKLTQQHVGMGPKHYRQYSQVLLAKQLLHQTRLSVEHIAHSVGFSSSRRLQAQMKSVTQLTPTQIRRNHEENRSDAIELMLHYRAPYDWPALRDFMALRAIKPIEEVTDNSYARYFQLDYDPAKNGFFRATHLPEKQAFRVEIQVAHMPMLLPVIQHVRRILDLDADPMAIMSKLSASGVPSNLLTQGLRLPGVWSPFEAGCRAILGQQVSVTSAINQLQRICLYYNDSRDGTACAFPTPTQIASISDDLLKMPLARKRALRAFAECFTNDPHPSPESLLAIKGIGPWTVNYLRMRGLSQPDMFLGTDLVVSRIQQKLTLNPTKASPWGSYLTFQLWQIATQENS
ncbi:AlkA N-terminal domain-containing protein [Alteromonas oceanisediminis]|uniref:AlkA N-terminal domain-containing protein n=1 Tax=Alteromonas oceanisediminis TaxID=2836180 RepID=UPI001BDAA537|nr:AlkA N-terminal domain-containing protein [Alteromonas oceanisediminis]MBT0586280.1 helix-turn-helix domain-containing protein [Alteromonas oceanisediminis]